MIDYTKKISALETKNLELEQQKKVIAKKISANKREIEKLRDERLLFEARRAGYSDEALIKTFHDWKAKSRGEIAKTESEFHREDRKSSADFFSEKNHFSEQKNEHGDRNFGGGF